MTIAPKELPRRNSTRAADIDNEDTWADVPRMLRGSENSLPPPWEEIFGPLRQGLPGDPIVVAQFGQSIDGRIATASGHSHYINGADGLAHLHRLRAIVDAVVIGVGTALADDPQLTVRRVAGPSPARVVIDPNGRLPPAARVLADDGVRRLVVVRDRAVTNLSPGVEMLGLPATRGTIPPAAILAALAERGFRRILIEGGADTVSRFLAAGCLDRLHVVIAPIIVGDGRPSVRLPAIERIDQALRMPMRAHLLGEEILLDCDLSGHRIGSGSANMST
jgi:diaminohydroxyphosphoribosylaminopyrimidine deaminase / 5-amino-6-(5-phosphoribosylamino)uracil reductase